MRRPRLNRILTPADTKENIKARRKCRACLRASQSLTEGQLLPPLGVFTATFGFVSSAPKRVMYGYNGVTSNDIFSRAELSGTLADFAN